MKAISYIHTFLKNRWQLSNLVLNVIFLLILLSVASMRFLSEPVYMHRWFILGAYIGVTIALGVYTILRYPKLNDTAFHIALVINPFLIGMTCLLWTESPLAAALACFVYVILALVLSRPVGAALSGVSGIFFLLSAPILFSDRVEGVTDQRFFSMMLALTACLVIVFLWYALIALLFLLYKNKQQGQVALDVQDGQETTLAENEESPTETPTINEDAAEEEPEEQTIASQTQTETAAQPPLSEQPSTTAQESQPVDEDNEQPPDRSEEESSEEEDEEEENNDLASEIDEALGEVLGETPAEGEEQGEGEGEGEGEAEAEAGEANAAKAEEEAEETEEQHQQAQASDADQTTPADDQETAAATDQQNQDEAAETQTSEQETDTTGQGHDDSSPDKDQNNANMNESDSVTNNTDTNPQNRD